MLHTSSTQGEDIRMSVYSVNAIWLCYNCTLCQMMIRPTT